MDCVERQDQILLYASNALDEAEAEELRAHLATGCAKCNAALREAKDFAGDLLGSLTPVTPSVGLKHQLMQSVLRDLVAPAKRSSDVKRLRMIGYVAAASIGFIMGMLLMYSRLTPQSDYQDKMRQLEVALADSRMSNQELQQMLGSSQTKLVSMGSAPDQPGGRALWDQEKRKWHQYIFNLKPPANGRTYELWFIPAGGKPIRAGIFDTDAKGAGVLVADLPADLRDLAVVAITDEPAGGSDQPTTTPFLVAKLQ